MTWQFIKTHPVTGPHLRCAEGTVSIASDALHIRMSLRVDLPEASIFVPLDFLRELIAAHDADEAKKPYRCERCGDKGVLYLPDRVQHCPGCVAPDWPG